MPKVEIPVVFTSPGRVVITYADGSPSKSHPKARSWVLEDQSMIVNVPGDDKRTLHRVNVGNVVELRRENKKLHVATLDNGNTVAVHAANCNCGLGIVGSAAPLDVQQYQIVRVRKPDWYIV